MSFSADTSRDQIDRLAEEFLARYRQGQRPTRDDIAAYAKQFPEIGEHVTDVIQVLLLMENLGAETVDDADSTPIPEQLGEFRIVRELGRGGMGVVYEAIQAELGRRVALKVLPTASLLKTSQLARFRREAKAAARLHHTNIVPVFGVGATDGVHYYAMQLIDGQSLDQVLKETRRQRSQQAQRETARNAGSSTACPAISDSANRHEYIRAVARAGQQIALALAHAHSQGMLHRDVKPSNIILDADGRAWLSDFGMALFDDGEPLTGTGDVVGTLRYMAPERFMGRSDPRSDVYSLGLTLYEMLTAKAAVNEVDRAKLIHQVLHEDPPSPRSVEPTVPRDLETIVLKAICKEPAHRYTSAADLAEDLGRFLADRPPTARRLSLWERTRRWVARNRGLTWMATAAFGAMLLGLAMTYAEWRRAERNVDLALRETRRAKQGYDAFRKTVDGLFDAFGADSMSAEAMPHALRKYLLDVAIEHHRELAALSEDDPQRQADLAKSFLRIADYQSSLGAEHKAVEICEEAESFLERATRQFPAEPKLRELLATVTSQLGYYRLSVNRVAASREALNRAIAMWSELLVQRPGDPDYLNGLAKAYNCLGFSLGTEKSSRDTLDESIQYHQRAVEIRRDLVSRFPESPVYKKSLALAISNLSGRVAEQAQFQTAIDLQLECNALFEELLDAQPESTDLRRWVAKGQNHLADKYRDFRGLPRGYDRAMRQYELSLKTQRQLVHENPGVVPLKHDLANTLVNIATIHYRRAKFADALRESEEALRVFDELLQQEPQSIMREAMGMQLIRHAGILMKLDRRDEAIAANQHAVQMFRDIVKNDNRPKPRERLKSYLLELSENLRQAGRFDEAINATIERRSMARGNADDLFVVARDFATTASATAKTRTATANDRAASKLDKGSTRLAPNVELIRAADLALDSLNEAIAIGWQDFSRLQQDARADELSFGVVWENATFTRLPPKMAFAFDIRARKHLAQAELVPALGDWTRLAAQGLGEPTTYAALARIYLRVPEGLDTLLGQ